MLELFAKEKSYFVNKTVKLIWFLNHLFSNFVSLTSKYHPMIHGSIEELAMMLYDVQLVVPRLDGSVGPAPLTHLRSVRTANLRLRAARGRSCQLRRETSHVKR